MLLLGAVEVRREGIERLAWNGIHRYHNADLTAKQILTLHGIEPDQLPNAKKQAQQIKLCLIQGEEYFRAAKTVGLATRPVLLYYGIMAFALAEILLKQDGNSSLDRARGQHAHHGLDFRKDGNPALKLDASDCLAALRAVPSIKGGGERFGTFELWHRTQRDFPTIGKVERLHPVGAATSSCNIVAQTEDIRSTLMPPGGLSLLDCYRSIPHLQLSLMEHGIMTSFARGSIGISVDGKEGLARHTIIIHPSQNELLDKVLAGFKFAPRMLEEIYIKELPSGCVVEATTFKSHEENNFQLPSSVQYDTEEIYFFSSERILNEFGNLYISLFILGNYARYFPDQWMVEVERSTPVSIISAELMEFAMERVPVIVWSELTRMAHIFK